MQSLSFNLTLPPFCSSQYPVITLWKCEIFSQHQGELPPLKIQKVPRALALLLAMLMRPLMQPPAGHTAFKDEIMTELRSHRQELRDKLNRIVTHLYKISSKSFHHGEQTLSLSQDCRNWKPSGGGPGEDNASQEFSLRNSSYSYWGQQKKFLSWKLRLMI